MKAAVVASERDYPTEEELERIRVWPADDPIGFMDLVKSIWWMADWGWDEQDGRIHCSTGGWSGNEELIGAMRDNFILWGKLWYSARRGGHYEFHLPGAE